MGGRLPILWAHRVDEMEEIDWLRASLTHSAVLSLPFSLTQQPPLASTSEDVVVLVVVVHRLIRKSPTPKVNLLILDDVPRDPSS